MLPSSLPSPFYPLATERLDLRPWKPEDAPDLVTLANDKRISEKLARMPYPYTSENADQFIAFSQEMLSQRQGIHLAIVRRKDQVLLGGIGCDEEVGYWLGHRFWGQGYGKEAAKTFVRFLFFVCRTPHLYGSSLETNVASQRILEAIGLRVLTNR